MRAGRKSKNGPREANGRPQRESKDQIQRAVLANRCRTMGWPKTAENLLRADDAALATFPGRLKAAGHLTQREYLGIMAYENVMLAYRRAIEAPPATAQGMSMAVTGGGGAICEPFDADAYQRHVRGATEAFMRAEGVLLATGYKAHVLDALSVREDVSPHGFVAEAFRPLKAAGLALADHFGACA